MFKIRKSFYFMSFFGNDKNSRIVIYCYISVLGKVWGFLRWIIWLVFREYNKNLY